jgi:hypothetical protein
VATLGRGGGGGLEPRTGELEVMPYHSDPESPEQREDTTAIRVAVESLARSSTRLEGATSNLVRKSGAIVSLTVILAALTVGLLFHHG